jgi:hypothetical protein
MQYTFYKRGDGHYEEWSLNIKDCNVVMNYKYSSIMKSININLHGILYEISNNYYIIKITKLFDINNKKDIRFSDYIHYNKYIYYDFILTNTSNTEYDKHKDLVYDISISSRPSTNNTFIVKLITDIIHLIVMKFDTIEIVDIMRFGFTVNHILI